MRNRDSWVGWRGMVRRSSEYDAVHASRVVDGHGEIPVPRRCVVIACLSGAEATEAEDRGYLGLGSCPGGVEPVVKPVAAVAGDVITVTPKGIVVNGTALPHTAPLAKDSAGRPLQAVPAGTYRVAPGTVWLSPGHDPRSFDSRYFGPVPIAAIRAGVKPLVTFR